MWRDHVLVVDFACVQARVEESYTMKSQQVTSDSTEFQSTHRKASSWLQRLGSRIIEETKDAIEHTFHVNKTEYVPRQLKAHLRL